MKAASIQHKELIEDIGMGIEERAGLSPLASRIYALLTMTSYDGLTFDEIKESIEASKSSISVNIKVLLQLRYIEYYTKPGDRKRYFKVSKYFQIKFLEIYMDALEKQITLVDKINNYNKEFQKEKFVNEESLGLITQDYLTKMRDLVAVTIAKIAEFQTTE
ncbi:MarR family transcriptional regulator [Bizionia gelidisalsuginis]|uniref:MarR family transcriptional regulator n=1 Tax=Bizionia gelidisalsuginis TaxID=291188 RepID=A0ABY3MA36_9FLAO|nr:transcriptional regulator [Bizionia gelidisalsuginis]TYC12076.1 MarR family transcriptional regulator [Bizionia gelidisalsuginis]